MKNIFLHIAPGSLIVCLLLFFLITPGHSQIASWQQSGSALPSEAVSITGSDNGRLLTATHESRQRFWQSADRGLNWVRIDGTVENIEATLLTRFNKQLQENAKSPSFRVPAYEASQRPLAITVSDEAFYALTNDQRIVVIYKNRRAWTEINIPLNNRLLTDIAFVDGVLIALDTERGLWILEAGGSNIERVDWIHTDLNNIIVNAMVSTSNGVFVASDTGGVFFSENGMSEWTQRNTGLSNLDVLDLIATQSGNLFAATNGDGIFRSNDNGLNWTQANNGLGSSVVLTMAEAPAGEVYAGTVLSGVFRSEDSGLNWENKSDPSLLSTIVYKIAVDQSGDVFAGTAGEGLYSSSSRGDSWDLIGLSGIDVRTLEPDVAGGFLAGAWFDGIYRYSGVSWSQIALPNTHVMDILEAGPYMLAASHGAGIFRSDDAGANWVPFNDGLTNAGVWSFVVDNAGHVYAGTNGSGVFRSMSPVLTGLEPTTSAVAKSFELKQNYPNPFNPATTIEFATRQSGSIYIDVVDPLGRTVAILLNESRAAGQYQLSFDAANLASGVYLYRMQFDGNIEVKKMLLVR
ncbi:MAG: ligand-binding sensor domain-containing protein [Calditrichia bacterium]